VPLPDHDFDVTEVAVPWKILRDAGHTLVFATEIAGARPAADPRLLEGVIFGKLGAAPDAIAFYRELEAAPEFTDTIAWSSIDPARFDGLLLAGGHAPRMRQYLGSEVLQQKVAAFWATGKPVAAICHGTIVLARARDAATGKSVLAQSRTTCLPGYMERLAYSLTFWKLGRYYRTYDAYVEEEVRGALDDQERQFLRGPTTLGAHGTMDDDSAAFVVDDGRYVSARWPGDAYAFARLFASKL
ncbi:MAG: type 1 glutamine amidotransferase domain-containing protein, partial [Polyangiales bacterium]